VNAVAGAGFGDVTRAAGQRLSQARGHYVRCLILVRGLIVVRCLTLVRGLIVRPPRPVRPLLGPASSASACAHSHLASRRVTRRRIFRAFRISGDTKRLEVVRRRRSTSHFYFYFVHPEFGFATCGFSRGSAPTSRSGSTDACATRRHETGRR
jgi:hypothetical protein